MPSASDLRDVLPPPSSSTETPTENAQGPTSNADLDLKRPPAGDRYATQAQVMAAAALAQAQERPKRQGHEDESRGDRASGADVAASPDAVDTNVNANKNAVVETGPAATDRPPAPTRRIIQIETPTYNSKSKSKRQLLPHSSTIHPGISTNLNGGQTGGEKMDGLTRELYALIGDNAPSLAQVRAELAGLSGGSGAGSGSGRRWEVGKRGAGEGKRWRQTPFQPSNRSTPLTLKHWRPLPTGSSIINDPNVKHHDKDATQAQGQGQGQGEDPFEPFGREGAGGNVMSYSQVEYDAWLTDDKWTPHETNYLFSLLKSYDLRFLIVTDRYAYVPPGGKTGQDAFEGMYAWPALVGKGPAKKKQQQGKDAGPAGLILPGESVRRSSRMGVGSGGGRNSRGATPLGSTSASVSANNNNNNGTAATAPLVETDVKTRSMEEIKDRYYTVCRRLLRNRPAVDEALKEKMVKAFDYDIHREVARKKYANSLFHLTRPQMLEEEALYVELKRMEQTERRYRSDREELMRVMGGLDSGVLVPGEQGNRAFGRGEAIGIGLARGADGSVLADKLKKRRRGEDGEPAQDVDMPPPPPVKKKVDPMFDERNNITRVPPPPGQLTTSRNTHQPAYLRSTRLPAPKPHLSIKTNALLAQLSISTVRLVMPTRDNVVALEKVIQSAEGLVEMKRLVDRAEVEVRTLKAQRDGIPVPVANAHSSAVSGSVVTPIEASGVVAGGMDEATPKSEDVSEAPKSGRNAQRSASVVSSTTSELKKKK